MTHTYHISGMTCTGCKATVTKLLSQVEGIQQVAIDLEKQQAVLTMQRHIDTATLKSALKDYSKYQLSDASTDHHVDMQPENTEEVPRSWLQTYKPVLLIFAYLLLITISIELTGDGFNGMRWMSYFMGGFFITFSFFKWLDPGGFADSYATYDIVAQRWHGWGYAYAFIELLLGIAFVVRLYPVLSNSIALIVMSISMVGVLQSVLAKRKIKCACLGAVFNLPMSTVTIIEDGLMIAMSGWALITLI
ncbi:MAG: cation transporter [Chitinophagaceae bacterium]|nr:cation transporter [Chitinophagaceae bacterium]